MDSPMPPCSLFSRASSITRHPLRFLVIEGIAIAYFFLKAWAKSELRRSQLQANQSSTEIKFLKSQINPHFLFNTLNNIYAIVIDTSPRAADMIDKLSEMMRYTTKDTQQDFVLLDDEISYISNYIELQKLRLVRSVKLDYDCPADIPALRIAPMLLIPFVENAFKHVSRYTDKPNSIKICLCRQDNLLLFNVVNSKSNEPATSKGSIGLKNVKRRLELLYANKYELQINNELSTHAVHLKLQLP